MIASAVSLVRIQGPISLLGKKRLIHKIKIVEEIRRRVLVPTMARAMTNDSALHNQSQP